MRSTLTVATNVPVSSTPSRLTVLKPVNENGPEFGPGHRSTMRYWPVASVATDRTFSIRTGLAASTVTPGSTPPETSLTTPAIAACAKTTAGRRSSNDRSRTDRVTTFDTIHFSSNRPSAAAYLDLGIPRKRQSFVRGRLSEDVDCRF